jgi:hypothetical protein
VSLTQTPRHYAPPTGSHKSFECLWLFRGQMLGTHRLNHHLETWTRKVGTTQLEDRVGIEFWLQNDENGSEGTTSANMTSSPRSWRTSSIHLPVSKTKKSRGMVRFQNRNGCVLVCSSLTGGEIRQAEKGLGGQIRNILIDNHTSGWLLRWSKCNFKGLYKSLNGGRTNDQQ